MTSRIRLRRTKDERSPSADVHRPASPAAMYLQLAADQHELTALEPSRSRRVLAIVAAFTIACFIPLAAAKNAAAHTHGKGLHGKSSTIDFARKSDTHGDEHHKGHEGDTGNDNASGGQGTGANSNGASGTQNASGGQGTGANSNGASGTQNASGGQGTGANSNGASGTQNATGGQGTGANSNAGASGTGGQQQGVAGANGTAPAVTPAQTAPNSAVKATTKKKKHHKKHKKLVKPKRHNRSKRRAVSGAGATAPAFTG